VVSNHIDIITVLTYCVNCGITRVMYGLTQVEIAQRLGINRSAVCRMLSGAYAVRHSTIKRLAEVVGRTELEVAQWMYCKRAGQPLPE
jgi:transcriptional regulator with XRE-family HTH domain